jgi:cytochrome c oxidase subunit 4
MDYNLGLLLAIATGLLIVAGGMGAALAFGISKLSPLPAKPSEPEKAPAEPVDEEALAARKTSYRQGIYVLIGLAVLTAAEFGVAVALEGSMVFLFVLALVKAGVIIQYYMHLDRVWSEEEAH